MILFWARGAVGQRVSLTSKRSSVRIGPSPLMKINPNLKNKTIFLKNFIGGLGWMLGATVGFALLVAVLSVILNWLGGLPIIGGWIANLIETTNQALETKKSLP